MSHRFLLLNVRSGAPLYPFALVDHDRYDELSQFAWTTKGSGQVVRTWWDEKGTCRHERLAHRVLGYAGEPKVWFVNGDPLDCRRVNLQIATRPSPLPERLSAGPGEVVAHFSGYDAALTCRPEAVAAWRARHGRTSFYFPDAKVNRQYLDLLLDIAVAGPGAVDAVKAQQRGLLRSPVRFFRGLLAADWGGEAARPVADMTLRLFLRGRLARVPGFDYNRLAVALGWKPEGA